MYKKAGVSNVDFKVIHTYRLIPISVTLLSSNVIANVGQVTKPYVNETSLYPLNVFLR